MPLLDDKTWQRSCGQWNLFSISSEKLFKGSKVTKKLSKKQLRTAEYHNNLVKAGVSQHVTAELEKQDYDKAIEAGVICIADENDDMTDVKV